MSSLSLYVSTTIHLHFSYHSAPSAEPVIHIYDSANSGYLEVIDYASSQSHYSERNNKEIGDGVSNTTNNEHDYEEID